MKNKIMSELAVGVSPEVLSKKYKRSVGTIRMWKRKMEQDVPSDDATLLTVVDRHTLHNVAERIKADAPEEIKAKIDAVVDGADGMRALAPKFQSTVAKLLDWADNNVNEDTSIAEWAVISKSISQLYSAIYSKNTTLVNVLNDNSTKISNEKREMFKAKVSV